jgi:hypothetical protein
MRVKMGKPVDKSTRPKNVKIGTVAFALLTSLVCIGSSTQTVHADQAAATLVSVSYGTVGSYNAVKANLTCNWSAPMDLVEFAVWKNSAGQTVAVSTGGLTLAPGANGIAFAPVVRALATGSYVVSVYAITTDNNPVTLTVEISVTI